MSDIFVTRALYNTLVEHLALNAGTASNIGPVRNVLRALPLRTHRLEVLADHLARLDPCPFTGHVTEDQIKVALGEVGDVWPNSIRGHVIGCAL